MTEEERYFFDLYGYLVIEGALAPAEVAELNAEIDSWSLPPATATIESQRFGGFFERSAGFRRLLAHPRIFPVLKEMIDRLTPYGITTTTIVLSSPVKRRIIEIG